MRTNVLFLLLFVTEDGCWICMAYANRVLDRRDVKDQQEYCQICAVINLAVYTYSTLMTEQTLQVFHHLSSSKIL